MQKQFQKFLLTGFLLMNILLVKAQPGQYTTANAHSHNDYEQAHPFWEAYHAGFGSIEADIFLVNGVLLVGHNTSELTATRSLTDLYLKPLLSCLNKEGGHPYTDTSRHLQMLIDVKTNAVKTLNALVSLLKQYPELIHSSSVKWVISGNQPAPGHFADYPSFIWFDGKLNRTYSSKAMTRIAMFSDDLERYTKWKGEGPIPEKELKPIQHLIFKTHQLHKTIRFWDSPDSPEAWQTFVKLGVDYINTDHIEKLTQWMNDPE
jgi:alkaline phosphatase